MRLGLRPQRVGVDRARRRVDGEHQPVVAVGAVHDVAEAGVHLLHLVEVDPQAEHLREAVAAADDLVEAVRGTARHVAGAQHVDVAPAAEVGRRRGVAEHHVGALVDELTDLDAVGGRQRQLGQRLQRERPAGDREADRRRRRGGEVGREVGHPGGGLGLAVHHEQVPPTTAAEVGVLPHPVGREPPPGLGQVAQRRQVQVGEPDPVEQVERVGHRREGGHPVGADGVPEAGVDDGEVGQQQGRAGGEVAVDHREAVAVVHRQRGRRDVAGADAQVGRDRLRVGGEVLVGEPDQLRRAGGARRREHQREVRVQVVDGAGAALEEVAAAQQDVGVVGVDDRVEVPGVVAGDEDHRMPTGQRGEVGHDGVDVVGAGEEDEPPGAAEPLGETGDADGEVAVRHGAVGGHQGRPVAVRGEAAPEAGGDARRAGQQRTHRRRILGKPYLCQREPTHSTPGTGPGPAAVSGRRGGRGPAARASRAASRPGCGPARSRRRRAAARRRPSRRRRPTAGCRAGSATPSRPARAWRS